MSSTLRESNETTDRPHTSDGELKRKSDLMTKSERIQKDQINWWAIIWLGLAHVGAVFAIWTFTWQALLMTLFLHWVCGCLGITLGYHRLLTHTGFKTYAWVRYMFATIGTVAGEGSPLDWVADHRKHHAHSDMPGDPHSPHDGTIWSHMFWLAFDTHGGDRPKHLHRWCPDLASDRGMWFIDKMFLPINILVSLAVVAIGYGIGGTSMALSFFVWGVALRLVLVLHTTWFVNSAAHIWGYRNYETTDNSRNNWWVALLSYGEGWHNNHHAYPRMAKHGHNWWELDVTWNVIRLLRLSGLAWDVVDYRTAAEKRKQAA
jgi:stearoyl-CoA desaturase (delta-9 desaturase)